MDSGSMYLKEAYDLYSGSVNDPLSFNTFRKWVSGGQIESVRNGKKRIVDSKAVDWMLKKHKEIRGTVSRKKKKPVAKKRVAGKKVAEKVVEKESESLVTRARDRLSMRFMSALSEMILCILEEGPKDEVDLISMFPGNMDTVVQAMDSLRRSNTISRSVRWSKSQSDERASPTEEADDVCEQDPYKDSIAYEDLVVSVLKKAGPDGVSSSYIRGRIGGSSTGLRALLNKMKSEGKVKAHGNTRGTKYSWALSQW